MSDVFNLGPQKRPKSLAALKAEINQRPVMKQTLLLAEVLLNWEEGDEFIPYEVEKALIETASTCHAEQWSVSRVSDVKGHNARYDGVIKMVEEQSNRIKELETEINTLEWIYVVLLVAIPIAVLLI